MSEQERKDGVGRLKTALELSGDGKAGVAEATEVFHANAEAERNAGGKTKALVSRLVAGHGGIDVWKEVGIARPSVVDEAHVLGEIVARRNQEGTIFDGEGKLADETLDELGRHGYFGLLIPKKFGGCGLSFTQAAEVILSMVKSGSFDCGLGVSVDEGIGMVAPLLMYGTEEQKERYLYRKARGKIRSWFALTELQAGSAVGRILTRFTQDKDDPDSLLVYGHKRFTTGVRLSNGEVTYVGVLIGIDDAGQKRALIVELPEHEDETFKLFPYNLLPLSRVWNIGMEFDGFKVPKANLIPKAGMVVPFSLLNRGRYFLLAGALGTTLKYLRDLVGKKPEPDEEADPAEVGWVNFRHVQGKPIGDYEIVQHRLARMLGMSVTLRALMSTMGHEIDCGRLAEIEGLIAKPTASSFINEAGDLSLTTWGGRGLLADNASGIETQDRRAVKIYEGEDTVLILKLAAMVLSDLNDAVFGGFFDGIAMLAKGYTLDGVLKSLRHLPGVTWWTLRKALRVRFAQPFARSGKFPELEEHLTFALKVLEKDVPLRVVGLFFMYGMKLPKHQAPLFRLGQKIQWANLMIHTVLWATLLGDDLEKDAALNELAHLKRLILTPEPSAKDDARARRVGQAIRDGHCCMLSGVPVSTEIPLVYHEPALGAEQPVARADQRLGRH
jgi:alkylation response protein AidB-like acyl-CoA dehydrogenase